MQRKHEDGRRPRISVSVEPLDYAWIQSFKGPSDSFTVNRILTAARLQGVTLDDVKSGNMFEEFADWLSKQKKSKVAAELHELLDRFLSES